MTPLIAIDRLSYAFGTTSVLRDVSLTVDAGEHLSILGCNGSGKSTLLRLLGRILNPPVGSVTLAGRPIERYSRKALARQIAYVPQTHFKQVSFTVAEYLNLARYPHYDGWRKMRPADRSAVDKALHDTGTGVLADRRMSTLSGGECQKVLIAAALVQESPILLLDEATAFLDFKYKTDIHRLLVALNRNGKTILSVSHDINHAALISSRIVALKDGALAFDGSPDDFMTEAVMLRVFAEQVTFAAHPVNGRPVVLPRAVSE